MAELCVALDVPGLDEAERLLDLLAEEVGWFKVGLELFTAAGPDAVRAVRARGARAFLDLKLHDIPATVARATAAAAAIGADLLTAHAAAGEPVLRAACGVKPRPRLAAVTVLTSDARAHDEALVIERGRAALAWGCEGLVCAPAAAHAARAVLGHGFLLVTPGVRPAHADADDHARVATPREAARAGADLIVVGRPVRDAPDPRAAARAVAEEIRAGSG